MHSLSLVRLVLAENRPAEQLSAADAPTAHHEPALHDKQAVARSAGWKVPASHLTHLPCFCLSLYVPALHGVCWMLPVDAK